MPARHWLALLWYQFLHFLLRLMGAVCLNFRVVGREHVPSSGGGLLLANHQSFADPILLGMACDRHIWQLARKSLERSRLYRWLIRPMGSIAVDRDGAGFAGLKETVARLKHGELVVMFPEGTRSLDGSLQPLKPGVGLIARRAQVPLIPIGIDGAFAAWPRQQKLPHLATIQIVFGPPISAEETAALDERALLAELQRRMQACLDDARDRRLRRDGTGSIA